MYRFLIKPRWIGFALFVVLMVITCLLLSRWQIHRLKTRDAYNAVIHHNINQAPVSPSELLTPGKPFTSTDLWRSVAVSGQYDAAHVLLVRKRTNDGQPGFYVMTPFRGENGVGLWLNRGWIPVANTARTAPSVPPTPTGTLTVIARLRYSEPARTYAPADLPAGQIDLIDVPGLSASLPYPTYDGYGEVISEDPQIQPAPQTIDPPEVTSGPHLSYAIQWASFAVVAVVGAVVIVRKEAEQIAEERAAAAAAEAAGEAGADAGPDAEGPTADPGDDAARDEDGTADDTRREQGSRTSVEGNA